MGSTYREKSFIMLVVGLTGGMGSGKSTAAHFFECLGVPIIDTDQIARKITVKGEPAYHKIIEYFGLGIQLSNGELNRKALANIIFNNWQKKMWLEALLHPEIETKVKESLFRLKAAYCIVAVPLLIESGGYSFIDRILVVDVDLCTQKQRIQDRESVDALFIEKVISAQAKREERLARADDIIENSGSLEAFKKKVQDLHKKYLAFIRREQGARENLL